MIHSTAIINKQAKISKDVEIGAYSIVGENVSIDAGTCIKERVFLENAQIGKDCKIFGGAIIGSIPQDLKFKEEKSYVEIGDKNTIREYVTINRGTTARGKTAIGNNNLIMAYSHIAHDCLIGDDVVIANAGTLAGHVDVEDKAVIGGLAAIHQFVCIGSLAIVGGCSKVVKDIPPYSLTDGHPARVYGLNSVGLKRAGFSDVLIAELKRVFKVLFFSSAPVKDSLEKFKKENSPPSTILHLVKFIESSQRGITKGQLPRHPATSYPARKLGNWETGKLGN
ncbi:MAG: acyl-ACP--UDP-N-acetylglucosamine O-acyltransferase [Candidatus Omnitrophica bacterium]|nr:acyl-ACP--UDP-N-acetylglucosamine O-acyltransferase [Candidatus Omnitrophota bacterium]